MLCNATHQGRGTAAQSRVANSLTVRVDDGEYTFDAAAIQRSPLLARCCEDCEEGLLSLPFSRHAVQLWVNLTPDTPLHALEYEELLGLLKVRSFRGSVRARVHAYAQATTCASQGPSGCAAMRACATSCSCQRAEHVTALSSRKVRLHVIGDLVKSQ